MFPTLIALPDPDLHRTQFQLLPLSHPDSSPISISRPLKVPALPFALSGLLQKTNDKAILEKIHAFSDGFAASVLTLFVQFEIARSRVWNFCTRSRADMVAFPAIWNYFCLTPTTRYFRKERRSTRSGRSRQTAAAEAYAAA
jgi:hypothetical protein